MPLSPPEILHLHASPSPNDVLASMGVPYGTTVRPRLQRMVDETVSLVREQAHPLLIWREGPARDIESNFPASRRLARYLAPADRAAVVAASIGPEWAAVVAGESDPMRAYVFGAAATAMARHSLVQARRELAHRHPDARIGDSLSPGTDGLPFLFQADLAALLPLSKIDVEFDAEYGLMNPLASVSAIIAWGNHIEREEPLPLCGEALPRCRRCPSPRCQLRIEPHVHASVSLESQLTI